MRNIKSFVYSLLALAFMILTFTKDWIFIAPAAFLSWLGWRELVKPAK